MTDNESLKYRGVESILAEVKMNLNRGRIVATGIGVFLVVINGEGNPLLRRRLEDDSLFGEDLSGKWELLGGGMEIFHLASADIQEPEVSKYHRPILWALAQELDEEAGLKLVGTFPLMMVPAIFNREYEYHGEKRESIDLALSVAVPFSVCEETERFSKLKARGELMFVPRAKLTEVDFVSPRIKFLMMEALRFYDMVSV